MIQYTYNKGIFQEFSILISRSNYISNYNSKSNYILST